jgi:hypothetical protein
MSTDTSTRDSYETYFNGGKFPPPSLPTSRGMLPLCRCLPPKPMIIYISTTLENPGRRFWRCRDWQVSCRNHLRFYSILITVTNIGIGLVCRKKTKPVMSGFGMMILVQLPDQWFSAIQLFQTQGKQSLLL